MALCRRMTDGWLVVASLCASGLLAEPAVSWAQELVRSSRAQGLRLVVGDTVWVTQAPQLAVEKKTEGGINRSWEDLLGSARIGKKITVTLVDSSSMEGKLLAIDAGSITVEQPGGPRTITAGDVLRVRYAGVRQRHVRYGMLIGAVVGGLATWAIDSQSSHPSSAGEAVGMGALLIGLPVGAIVGAALPVGPPLYGALQAGSTRR